MSNEKWRTNSQFFSVKFYHYTHGIYSRIWKPSSSTSVVSKPRCWFLICFTREMCCICEWSHWWIAECHIAAILKALDTIGICSKKNKRTNLIGNEHWRVLDSITYCEKRLLWSNVVFEKEVFLNQNYLNLFWPVALFRHLKAHNNIVQYRCFCFHYSPATLMTNWV